MRCARILISFFVSSAVRSPEVTTPFERQRLRPVYVQHIGFLLSAAAPQNGFDMGKQNRDVVGLGNIVITAQTQRPQLVHGGIAAGDEDDWDACFAVDIRAQGEAVPSGKPEIEKNEIRAALRGVPVY